MVAFVVFSYRYFGRISDEKRYKKAVFQFVGWCIINIVPKHHTQIRKIERGMANLPLWP